MDKDIQAAANNGSELRRKAEEKVASQAAAAEAVRVELDSKRLLHELQVHQVELEMQNEELHQKQFELDVSRARYFDLYDLAPVGHLTLNENGLIQEANLTAATMLGVPRAALTLNKLSKFILNEDQDIYYHLFKQFNAPQTSAMRMLRADGSSFWAHIQSAPTANGENLITFNDISESKQAEEARQKLEQKFHQACLDSLGVLAGGIAHDFNNLLAVIIGHCSLAKMRPTKYLDSIASIEKAAEHAAELCQQMLAYAGKNQFVENQVNIVQLVEDMTAMLKTTVDKNVEIISRLSSDIPLITADASQISQIVMNLIINASEAIGEVQGQIIVLLTKTILKEAFPEKDHLGEPIPAGNYVCLEVTDNGCGMNNEAKRRIFEPFYTTKFAGRGLGMSAVLGIITSHKGALQLFSQPGKGTSIRIYLPIQDNDSNKTAPILQSSVSDPWKGSGRILLVEDEEEVMFVAKSMLEELGFGVVTATNGKEALELYQKDDSAINLVVTDIGMPVMDGFALVRELKKLKPELPIIISTGYGSTEVSSSIACEDMAGLIIKPFNFNKMREVLKNVAEEQLQLMQDDT